MSISDLRQDYHLDELVEENLAADPMHQFGLWFDTAVKAGIREPNAMTIASVDADGQPSARIVLLKGVDADGFVFYTNYDGRKGQAIEENPRVALLFWWGRLERQVRIEGTAERVSAAQSDAYFHSRPRGSQLGALASEQSRVIASREVLDRRAAELEQRYADTEIPRPPNWGGYRVRPHAVEFWQGRTNRMHDRLRYRRDDGGAWRIERLSP